MVDGRIDMQGTVTDLRRRGMLEVIKQVGAGEDVILDQHATQALNNEPPASADRKPRKLVQVSFPLI